MERLKREFDQARKQEEALRSALDGAKDEAERAKIEAKLAAAQKEKEAASKSMRGARVGGAKPAKKAAACNCPPGDPLCSCL